MITWDEVEIPLNVSAPWLDEVLRHHWHCTVDDVEPVKEYGMRYHKGRHPVVWVHLKGAADDEIRHVKVDEKYRKAVLG